MPTQKACSAGKSFCLRSASRSRAQSRRPFAAVRDAELKGHWSIWVNGNWRVTFRVVGTDIELVDYTDCH